MTTEEQEELQRDINDLVEACDVLRRLGDNAGIMVADWASAALLDGEKVKVALSNALLAAQGN